MIEKRCKSRMGLLPVCSPRFRTLGEGTAGGTYHERMTAQAAAVVRALEEDAEVVFDGLCYEPEDALRASERFRAEKTDFVTVLFLSWSEDEAFIRALRLLTDMPLLYACLSPEAVTYTDTQDENDFVDFLANGALVGFLEGSGSLKRFDKRACDFILGSMDDLKRKARTFGRAAMTRTVLSGSTVSLLSHYNELMHATYVDPYRVFLTFGASLHFLSVTDLIERYQAVDEPEAQAIVSRLAETYPVAKDVEYEHFLASVKASMAMEALAATVGTDLLVLNDVEQPLLKHIGLRPGFSPLYGERSPTVVPEGDIGAGLAVYILKLISGGHVNFIEPFYIDTARGVFAAGHAGPNDYTACPENVVIARDTRFAKSGYRHAGAPFAWTVFPEGLKTVLHVSECGGRVKMAFSTIRCLETKHSLASYSHADFTHTHLSNEEFFTRLARFGVTQHFVIADGDHTAALEAFAMLYDFDFLKL